MHHPAISECAERVWPRLAGAVPESAPRDSAMDYLEKIQIGDPAGIKEFYEVFFRGVRFLLERHLGPQSREDEVHEMLAAAAQGIRLGKLCDHPSVVEFVWVRLQRRIEGQERRSVPQGPVAAHLVQAMQRFLVNLSRKNREAFSRYYLLGQSQKDICLELKIEENQFRLLRGKAKAHFAELRGAPSGAAAQAASGPASAQASSQRTTGCSDAAETARQKTGARIP